MKSELFRLLRFILLLFTISLLCTHVEGRETLAQDMKSCLQHTLGLLETAALFPEVHKSRSSRRIIPVRHAGHVPENLKYHLLCRFFCFCFCIGSERDGGKNLTSVPSGEPNESLLQLLYCCILKF